MEKRGLSFFQIFILILGIIAFSFIIGENVRLVSAENLYIYKFNKNGQIREFVGRNYDEAYKKAKDVLGDGKLNVITDQQGNPMRFSLQRNIPTSAVEPTSAQKGFDWVFDKGFAAPKGYKWDSGLKKYVPAKDGGGASGFGYSTSGIIEGFTHALGIYYGITLIGGLFVKDDAKLNAIAKGAASGILVGKSVYSLFGKGGVWEMKKDLFGKITAKQLSIGAGVIAAAIVRSAISKENCHVQNINVEA